MALTTFQIKEFTRRAKAAGLNDDQIMEEINKKAREMSGASNMPSQMNVSATAQQMGNARRNGVMSQTTSAMGDSITDDGGFTSQFVSTLVDPSTQRQMEPKSVEGFAGNIGRSFVKNVGDLISAVVNVVNPNLEENTIANIAGLGIDAVKFAGGDRAEANKALQVVNYYKKRYGEDLTETLYTDPVGVLLDISTVVGGAGGLAKATGTAGKVSALTKAGTTATKIAGAIDPIAQAGNAAGRVFKYTKVADKVAETTQATRQSLAEEAARRSLRANPTQMEKFQELIGTADEPGDIGKWMTEKGIYTKEDVSKVIKEKQKTYNSLVRTDKSVDPKRFADALKKKAADIEASDVSPSAKQVVDKLKAEADRIESLKSSTNLTDTILTNSKTSSFGKVSKKAMTDPVTDNFNKAYGEVGLQLLDEIAPGSAAVGKELQILREFDGIVSKQRNLGKGSQLINIFKPAFTGMTGGFILGSGVPGFGSGAGAISGAIAAGVATNPFVQRSAAKMLIEGVQVPEMVGKATNAAKSATGPVAKGGRMVNPAISQEQSGSDQEQLQTVAKTQATSDTIDSSSYGASIPDQRKEAITALMQGGIQEADVILELLNYDADGNKVGDFTMAEVLSASDDMEAQQNDPMMEAFKSPIPSPLNPFGGMTKKQVLRKAASDGANRAQLKELAEYYDMLSDDQGTLSEDNIKLATSLRDEYFKRTKESGFIDVASAAKKIQKISDSPSGDIALIFSYMKLLDPGSTVREGEFDNVQGAASYLERTYGKALQIGSGNRLTEKQRAEIKAESANLYQQHAQTQANIDAFYQGYAQRIGIDPSLIGVGLYK